VLSVAVIINVGVAYLLLGALAAGAVCEVQDWSFAGLMHHALHLSSHGPLNGLDVRTAVAQQVAKGISSQRIGAGSSLVVQRIHILRSVFKRARRGHEIAAQGDSGVVETILITDGLRLCIRSGSGRRSSDLALEVAGASPSRLKGRDATDPANLSAAGMRFVMGRQSLFTLRRFKRERG